MPLTNTTDGSLRSLRIIHGTVLVAMGLLVDTAEVLTPHEPRDLGRILPIVFGIVSLQVIGLALYFRTTKIRPALEILQLKPDDPKALQQWRAGGILTAVLMDTVVLFGFSLRFVGAAPKISLPFYIAGIALMLLWWPRKP